MTLNSKHVIVIAILLLILPCTVVLAGQIIPPISPTPFGSDIHKILKTSSGEYYIATNNGFSHWLNPGQFRNYTIYDGLVANLVYDIEEDEDGRIWLATEGGISIFDKGKFTNLPCGPDFIRSGIIDLEWQTGKMIAITFSDGKLVFENDTVLNYPSSEPHIESKGDAHYLGQTPYDFSPQKVNFSEGKWKKILGPGIQGHYPKNYLRFRSIRWESQVGTERKKIDQKILAMEPIRDGKAGFWIVMSDGELRQFDAIKGRTKTIDLGAGGKSKIYGLSRDSKRRLWVFAENYLFYINDDDIRSLTIKKLAYKGVGKIQQIIEDGTSLWFLADEGLLKLKNDNLQSYTYNEGLPPGPILAIKRDTNNNVWVGGPGGFGMIVTEEKEGKLLELEKSLRKAERISRERGFKNARSLYEQIVKQLENYQIVDGKAQKLLATARYHLISEDCPTIGWRLEASSSINLEAQLSINRACNVINKPLTAVEPEEDQKKEISGPLKKHQKAVEEISKPLETPKGHFTYESFLSIIQPIEAALQELPHDRNLLLIYGNVLLANRWWKDVEKVKSIFMEDRFEGDSDFLNYLGVAHAMLGENEKAEEIFNQILKDEPNQLSALFNRIRLLSKGEEKNRIAKELSQEYLKADPLSTAWHLTSQQMLDAAQRRMNWYTTMKYFLILLIVFSIGTVSYIGVRWRFKTSRITHKLRSDVPFAPIKNPYIVGNPIRGKKMFYGRKDDFVFVRRKLKGGDKSLVIVFCGERRSGKTSILFQILNGRLGEGFTPVMLDMQSIVPMANSEAEFLRKMVEETSSVIGNLELSSGLQWKGDEANPFENFELFIHKIKKMKPDEHLLFLFDEYELIEEKIREGNLGQNIIVFFASLLESQLASFIFTGSKRIEDRTEKFWKILIGKSVYRKISFLSKQDTVNLIQEPVHGQLTYGEKVVDQIIKLTAGSPFYTQVICQNLVDFANEKRTNYISKDNLETVITELLDNPLPQMVYFWDYLPNEEKLTLSLMGTALEKRNKKIGPKALVRMAKKEQIKLPFSSTDLQANLENLFLKDILLKDDLNHYRFRIDLLRRWIARDHSIWKVIRNHQ